jgi:hypothetical protein
MSLSFAFLELYAWGDPPSAALYNNFTSLFPTVYLSYGPSRLSLIHLKDRRRGYLC